MTFKDRQKAAGIKDQVLKKLKQDPMNPKNLNWFWMNIVEPSKTIRSYDLMCKALRGDKPISEEFETTINDFIGTDYGV